MIHPMMLPIATYMACLENPNALYFYSDCFEEMKGLVWEAMNTRQNMEICDPEARRRMNWNGFMTSGS